MLLVTDVDKASWTPITSVFRKFCSKNFGFSREPQSRNTSSRSGHLRKANPNKLEARDLQIRKVVALKFEVRVREARSKHEPLRERSVNNFYRVTVEFGRALILGDETRRKAFTLDVRRSNVGRGFLWKYSGTAIVRINP